MNLQCEVLEKNQHLKIQLIHGELIEYLVDQVLVEQQL